MEIKREVLFFFESLYEIYRAYLHFIDSANLADDQRCRCSKDLTGWVMRRVEASTSCDIL